MSPQFKNLQLADKNAEKLEQRIDAASKDIGFKAEPGWTSKEKVKA